MGYRNLFPLLGLLLFAVPAHATWTKAHDVTFYNNTNPGNPSFSGALTSPSILVVFAARAFQTSFASAPTDTAGNTFVDCGPGAVLYNSSGWVLQCWYALNTHTTTGDTLALANAPGSSTRINFVEFTGGVLIPPDKFSSTANGSTGVGGGQNMTTGAATTTYSGELVLGFEADTSLNPPNGATGTGFTTLASASGEYQVQSAAGSIAATWADVTNNDPYGAIMVTFKVAIAASKVAGPAKMAGPTRAD